jgi:putative ABC transport system permease protein
MLFRSYLKISWRNLLKDKRFTLLNGFGLSAGLACVILCMLWVFDELSFDKGFEHQDQLVQVMVNHHNNGVVSTDNAMSATLGRDIREEFPEVEDFVTTAPAMWFSEFNMTVGDKTVGAKGNFVSDHYFNVLSFRLLRGNATQVLTDPKGVVISESMAVKLFGSAADAMGKALTWKWFAFSKDVTVKGIYKDMPAQTSSSYDFVLPLDAWKDIVPVNPGAKAEAGGPFMTYLRLHKGVDQEAFSKKMSAFVRAGFPDASQNDYFVRSYGDQHLYDHFENGTQAGGRIAYVRMFTLIAGLILLIACINFMNLSTAKAATRAKEVGVKKTLGARRGVLVGQFLGESMLLTFAAFTVALIWVWLLLPRFNNLTHKSMSLPLQPGFWLGCLVVLLVTGLLAGSYPAFYLSRFQPLQVLKGRLPQSLGALWARKGLVLFQFALSMVFVISVLVIYRQIRMMETKDLGYEKDHVFFFDLQGKAVEKREAFIGAIGHLPGVINVSSMMRSPILPDGNEGPDMGSGASSGGSGADPTAMADISSYNQMSVNYKLIETMGIRMAEGRSFSAAYATDSAAVVINETAAAALGRRDALGTTVKLYGKQYHIIGVVKDFHFNSLHQAISPFVFKLAPQDSFIILVRVSPGKESALLDQIRDLNNKWNPGYTFNYSFLDNDYESQYVAERLAGSLAGCFAVLAVIISCLGLFGLAAFTAERREKEISIRKVLGASVSHILALLCRDFLYLALLACALSFPLSWWIMHQWLEGFAYRIEIGVFIFVGAGGGLLMLTLLTIGYQSLRAAIANPVGALHAE